MFLGCEGQKVPQSPKPQKIQSNEKVTLGVDPKVLKKVTKKGRKQGKSYFLATFSLLSGRPPKSLFRYFFVTLNFLRFRTLWDLLPLTILGEIIS